MCPHSSQCTFCYSLYGLQDTRVPADAQIVVTTPDRNILWGHRCLREMLGKGVGISPAIHSLKHTVGVVLFLLHDLVSEKLVITKDMASCRSRNRDRNNSTQISSWLVFILLILILSFLILFPCIHLFVQQMSYWFFNSFFSLFNMICINACVCSYIQVCSCQGALWNSENSRRHQSLFPVCLREGLLFTVACSRLAGPSISEDFPISAFNLSVGACWDCQHLCCIC